MAKRKAKLPKNAALRSVPARERPDEKPENRPEEKPGNDGPLLAGDVEDVTEVTGNIFAIFDPPPGDWRLRLSRADDYTKKWVPHGILLLPEAGMDQIQARFGGGKYRAQLIDVTNAIHGTREFSLPGPYNPPVGPLPGIGAGAPVSAAGPVSMPVPGGTLQSMSPREAVDTALVSSVLDMMKGLKQQGQTDWGPLLTVLITTAGSIVTALLQRKSGPDPALMSQLDALRDEVAKLRDRPGPNASAVTDALAGIERIVKVSSQIRDMAASPEGETSIWGALGKEAIGLLANAQRNQQPQPQAALPAPGAPNAMPLWQQLLLSQRARLLDAASRGLDPTMVADYAIQFMPEQHVGILTEFLARPDALAVVQQVIPELANFPAWCDAFIGALRAGMQPDEDEVTG